MATDLKDFMDREVYPELYEILDRALPEFEFRLRRDQRGDHWESGNNLKITGERGDRVGGVYCYRDRPYLLKDYTRGGIEITSYVRSYHAGAGGSWPEACRYLAGLIGRTLPDMDEAGIERYKRAGDEAQLWEDANRYLVDSLKKDQGAGAVRLYLKNRDYTPEEIESMELGYTPSRESLIIHLTNDKKYSREIAEGTIKLHQAIGDSHTLTIPYRDERGRIRGLAVRNIDYKDGDKLGKYLYSTGLPRGSMIFNLHRARRDAGPLVIVEGLFDSLIASARGLENVVALGGTSLNEDQVALLKRYSGEVILALDNDTAGETATLQAIETLGDKGLRVYVISLPAGIKDPDELIRKQGIDAFRERVRGAVPGYEYSLELKLRAFVKLKAEGKAGGPDEDRLIREIEEDGSKIKAREDRDRHATLVFMNLGKGLGISEETIKATQDELRYKKDKEERERTLDRTLREAVELRAQGKTAEAERKLAQEVRARTLQEGERLLPGRYRTEDYLRDMRDEAPALKTGIGPLDELVRIRPGALSLIAGRPSHGKTTLLFNLLLEMAELSPDKAFYLFSYEENKRQIITKILNRLMATDLSPYYPDYGVNTNYDFIKACLLEGRKATGPEDVVGKALEAGKERLRGLMDSGRITIIDEDRSVEELRSEIGALNSRGKVGAVLIDYIQRIPTNRRTQDKRTEVAYVSDELLQTARETGLPIILGAQMNRGTTDNRGKRPYLENLKEAGNLEEDANLVLSVYNETREKLDQGEDIKPKRDIELEIRVLKNRDGEVNRFTTLSWDRFTGIIGGRTTDEAHNLLR